MIPNADLIEKAMLTMLTVPLAIFFLVAVSFVYTKIRHNWREARNPIFFVTAVAIWMYVLNETFGLATLRTALGWTIPLWPF